MYEHGSEMIAHSPSHRSACPIQLLQPAELDFNIGSLPDQNPLLFFIVICITSFHISYNALQSVKSKCPEDRSFN
jgi:hypothetical protein